MPNPTTDAADAADAADLRDHHRDTIESLRAELIQRDRRLCALLDEADRLRACLAEQGKLAIKEGEAKAKAERRVVELEAGLETLEQSTARPLGDRSAAAVAVLLAEWVVETEFGPGALLLEELGSETARELRRRNLDAEAFLRGASIG